MRREERVTVQGPVKEQQPDGMSHRGGGKRPCSGQRVSPSPSPSSPIPKRSCPGPQRARRAHTTRHRLVTPPWDVAIRTPVRALARGRLCPSPSSPCRRWLPLQRRPIVCPNAELATGRPEFCLSQSKGVLPGTFSRAPPKSYGDGEQQCLGRASWGPITILFLVGALGAHDASDPLPRLHRTIRCNLCVAVFRGMARYRLGGSVYLSPIGNRLHYTVPIYVLFRTEEEMQFLCFGSVYFCARTPFQVQGFGLFGESPKRGLGG